MSACGSHTSTVSGISCWCWCLIGRGSWVCFMFAYCSCRVKLAHRCAWKRCCLGVKSWDELVHPPFLGSTPATNSIIHNRTQQVEQCPSDAPFIVVPLCRHTESPTQNPFNRTLSPARRDELAKIRQRQLANAVQYIWEKTSLLLDTSTLVSGRAVRNTATVRPKNTQPNTHYQLYSLYACFFGLS